MMPKPQPWIPDLPRYEPGRPLEEVARELGLDGIDDIVKLASNENALGPSPLAVEAMRREAERMHLYPDGGSFYFKQALAKKLEVTPDHILPGNGSNELIELLGHVYLASGSNIVMSERAFVIYRLMAMLFGAETIATPTQGFTHDLDAMRAAITPHTKMVFVANPNNPTGTRVDNEALDAFVRSMPAGVLTILDEAYVELLPKSDQPDSINYVREGLPVALLRTFSKGYGLAGLRLGYLIGAPELVALLNSARQPFNVNYMAQVAAVAALEDDTHLEVTRRMVMTGQAQITAVLDEQGIDYVPSCVNFLLVKVGEGRSVFQALQKEHIIVRPMDGYGLPEYIRVTVGTEQENARFLAALQKVMVAEACT